MIYIKKLHRWANCHCNLFSMWCSAWKWKQSLPMDNFSLTSQQLVPNYFLWPYKCPDFHLQINLPHFCANKLFSARGRHYSPFAYQLASLPKLSWGGIWRKELNLARNWLIIRSCQSPNLVRIECNADFLSRLQVVRDGSVGYLKRCNKKS